MKTWEGNLTVEKGMDLPQFSDLKKVTGHLYAQEGASLDAPALTSVGGDLYVREGASLDAPALTSGGENLYVWKGASIDAPALASVGGDLDVWEGASLDAPALASVGGDLYAQEGASIDAPVLASVGGDLYVWEGASLDAPLLPYCPEGELIGWKKCRDDVMVKLRIPSDAKRRGLSTGKCRAEYAEVLEVIGAEVGVSKQEETFLYHVGEIVRPDSFDESLTTCSNGIHFFLTRKQAEEY